MVGEREGIAMKKYQILVDSLKNSIASGKLTPGMQIDTEQKLSEAFDVSRQTVRRALFQLQQDGLIYSIQGSGSFVAYPTFSDSSNKRIAVITTYFSDYIFPAIIRGIHSVSFACKYTLEMYATNNSISTEKSILEALLVHPVAGIIVEGTKAALPNPNTIYYKQLSRIGIPIVFINSIYPQLVGQRGIISVLADDHAGGYEQMLRLIDMGHQKVGCIFKSDDSQGVDRFSGAIEALVERNVPFDDRNFIWFTTETKHSFMQSLAPGSLLSTCTAILCYNDEIAAVLVAHLKNSMHNIRAIASFDDNLNPAILPSRVSLCSLQHPKQNLGDVAARKLMNLLSGQDEDSIVLPWEGCSKYNIEEN